MSEPWGLSGPQFLAIFVAGLLLATFAPLLLRRLIGRVPSGRLTRQLDAYEVGYLADGPDRAADVIITELVSSGALRIDSSGHVTTADPGALSARSGSGLGELPELRLGLATQVYQVRNRLAKGEAVKAIGTRLRADRLLFSKARMSVIRVVSVALWLTLFVVGIARINEGDENNRPTGNLSALWFIALIVCAFTLYAYLGKSLRKARTRLGSQMLKEAEAEQGDGSPAPSAYGPGPDAYGPGLAGVALFGVALTGFAAVQDETLRKALLAGLPAPSSSSGSSGCGGGGCGGGCGGGGCGG